jgi:DNA-binding MarR family transcriptional regulator
MPDIEMPADFYEQTPEGNVVATEAVMNTVRTADMLFANINRLLRPLGVSAAGGLALGLLRDLGPLTPSDMGERLIVTRATVTGVVDSLERRGLVERHAHPDDRRRSVIEITEQGRGILQQVRTIVHRQERQWLSMMSEDELRHYIGQLQRIQRALEAIPPEA